MAADKLVNASQWSSIRSGSKIIYCPNPALLELTHNQVDFQPFWLHTFTAFACIMHDVVEQKIIAVRDHYHAKNQIVPSQLNFFHLNCMENRPNPAA